MKSLKEIGNNAFYNMENYHQISIDLIQETEELFDTTPENEEERTQLIENLNSIYYNIDIALEVFNPEYKIEISALKQLLSFIEIRIGYIKSLFLN
jgi:hypothetical protein